MKKVLTFGRYCRKKYGFDIRKIPISISGFTCPNIDGKVARGGCTFCQNESFSPNMSSFLKVENRLNFDRADVDLEDRYIEELINQYKKNSLFFEKNYGVDRFIIYFQSFTNTYAHISFLKRLYLKALSLKNVIGISIGTRTDCVDDEVLDFIASLDAKEVWIEYGIQSIHDTTLEQINRGHDATSMIEAIKKTKDRGIKTCAHLIYGLPGESVEMMEKSTDMVYDLGVDSVKLHPLYVVNKTALALSYNRGSFVPIDIKEYAQMVSYAIKSAPRDLIFQRISAGSSDQSLIAPKWCRDKNTQMAYLKKTLKEHRIQY